MPSLQSLRRKIAAFKNTQKITKAMKMVAAARLKRSQDRILAARPYAHKMRGVLGNLSRRVNRAAHPLPQKRAGERVRDSGLHQRPGSLRRLQWQHRSQEHRASAPVRLFPVDPAIEFGEVGSQADQKTIGGSYLYEPRDSELLAALMPNHFQVQTFRILLESAAAEHGARMAAMDGATRNAGELIKKVTLYYNKTRQAAITKN